MSRPFRDEFKFIVHHSVRTALLERWRRHLVKDPHSNEDAVSPILSLYYDSPHLDFYEDGFTYSQVRDEGRAVYARTTTRFRAPHERPLFPTR